MKIFRIFTFIVAALLCGNASAQKLTVGEVTIEPNGEATIAISIEAETVQCATNFTIALPDGITADTSDKTKFPGELIDDHSLDVTPNDAGTEVDVIIYSSNISNFKAASGVVFNLPIKAGDIEAGTLKGTISTITISDADEAEVSPDDFEFDITVKGEDKPYVEPEGTHQLENGLGNLKPGDYTNIGAWGGTWSGNQIENERDWSKFDYLWIKYKDFTGAINFGIMYNEWIASQSWGEQYKDETVAIKDPYGVIGIKINHTDTYVNGNAKENGEYIGDIFSKHIREIFIQATEGGSNITIEEMWLGSEEDYLKAVEDNKYVDETVYKDVIVNGDLSGEDVSCFFSKEWAPSGQIQNSRIVNGAIEVNSFAKISQDWDSQFWIRLPQKLAKGTKFKVSFDVMATAQTKADFQAHNEPGDWKGNFEQVPFDTEWSTFEGSYNSPSDDFHSIAFNLTKAEDITYYFKNIKVEIPEDAVTEGDTYTPEAAPYKEAEGTHQLAWNRLGFFKAGDYAPGAWGGQWSGNNIANERDWSDFDYFWIKYSGFTGAINFGIMYSEWLATQSWGEQYKDETVKVEDPEGVIGIKINNTDTYASGNAKENGAYVGDIFAKHIREVFIQATAGDSKITIEEFWIGSEEDYLKAVEDAQTATGIKSFSAAKKVEGIYNLAGQKVDKNYKGIVIVNGKKMMMK